MFSRTMPVRPFCAWARSVLERAKRAQTDERVVAIRGRCIARVARKRGERARVHWAVTARGGPERAESDGLESQGRKGPVGKTGSAVQESQEAKGASRRPICLASSREIFESVRRSRVRHRKGRRCERERASRHEKGNCRANFSSAIRVLPREGAFRVQELGQNAYRVEPKCRVADARDTTRCEINLIATLELLRLCTPRIHDGRNGRRPTRTEPAAAAVRIRAALDLAPRVRLVVFGRASLVRSGPRAATTIAPEAVWSQPS